jgi:hypothetical protein
MTIHSRRPAYSDPEQQSFSMMSSPAAPNLSHRAGEGTDDLMGESTAQAIIERRYGAGFGKVQREEEPQEIRRHSPGGGRVAPRPVPYSKY